MYNISVETIDPIFGIYPVDWIETWLISKEQIFRKYLLILTLIFNIFIQNKYVDFFLFKTKDNNLSSKKQLKKQSILINVMYTTISFKKEKSVEKPVFYKERKKTKKNACLSILY